MFEDLKKEIHSFLQDLNENIKDKQDLIYIKERTSQLLDVMIEDIEKVIDYRENKINAIIKRQEQEDSRIKELQEKIDNVYQDIYEEDDSFLINCPYCGTEFDAWVDEDLTEIKCPECSNFIELDWSGNPDDDQDGECGGNCSHCKGCE